MENVLSTMWALLMIFAYNTGFLPPAEARGDFYYAHPSRYFAEVDKTCAVWHRYNVWGEKYGQYGAYNKTSMGLQVWCYNGKVSDEQIRKDGRERADAHIVVQVGSN